MKQTGIVKRFNKIKGYGFLAADTDNQELFVHFSEVRSEGYKELAVGARVAYILNEGEKGSFATDVDVIA